MNGHLMASCIRNIRTKNYQNLIIGFKVTVKNGGDVFETQCICMLCCRWRAEWLNVGGSALTEEEEDAGRYLQHQQPHLHRVA